MPESYALAVRLLSLLQHAVLAACLAGLSGCTLEHKPHRLDDQASLHPPATPEFHLHFVEADDEGWFWQPAQADAALSQVKDSIGRRDTFVIVFVHGWHHSARCCDGNVEGFKEVLRRLKAELQKGMYASARALAGTEARGADDFDIVGIYVGWRGRSLPGLLDYATFWGRKGAAQRVGQADFQEFMARLQQLYDGHYWPPETASAAAPRNFLGIVSIGHSFGGQIVLNATSGFFERELQRVNPLPGYLRNSAPTDKFTTLSEPLRGFGDLVVLVNPAVEAAAYQRIHALSRSLRYSSEQTPLLLTISADNDRPRQRLFEIGRTVGEWFTATPFKEDARERAMERQALGVYGAKGEQVTHRLAPVDESLRLEVEQRTRDHEDFCSVEQRCSFDWYTWPDGQVVRGSDTLLPISTMKEASRIAQFDFSKEVVFAGVKLRPTAETVPYQPMIVASAHHGVIDGHNGMFSEPLMNFLIRYIGFTETKKFLLLAQHYKWTLPLGE